MCSRTWNWMRLSSGRINAYPDNIMLPITTDFLILIYKTRLLPIFLNHTETS